MKIVTGVFDSVRATEDTVRALMNAGFTDDDIGLLVRDTNKGSLLADDLGRDYARGATPPKGVVTSRGDIWDRLPDGYMDLIHRADMPDKAIGWYNGHLDRGDVLLVVNAGDRMDDAARIVRDHGGLLYGMERGERMERATTATETTTDVNEVHMPIVEEEALVEKTRHQVGEVYVTTDTTTRDVDIPLVVTHDEVRVERRKLDTPMTPEEYKGVSAEGGIIRMPVIEEEVRMTKRAIVREELVITRIPVSEQRTLHDTVTHTEPHVETTGDVRKEEGGKKRPAA